MQRAEKEIVDVARAILDRTVDLFEGVRRLTELRARVRAEDDADFVRLAELEARTPRFPPVRLLRLYDAKDRAWHDATKERYARDNRGSVEEICRSLIRKYGGTDEPLLGGGLR